LTKSKKQKAKSKKQKGKSQKAKAKRVEQAAYFNLNLYYPQEWHL